MRHPATHRKPIECLLAALALSSLLAHADGGYPKMFEEIALPLYEAYGFTRALKPLPGVGAMQERFVKEAELLLQEGRRIETLDHPDPAAAKAYLGGLRKVKSMHGRFLAESRKILLEAIAADDYARFEQIAASGLPHLLGKPGVMQRVADYYRKNRQKRRHTVLDALVRESFSEKAMYRRYLATKDAKPAPFVMALPATIDSGMETLDASSSQAIAAAARKAGIDLADYGDDYAANATDTPRFFLLFFASAAQSCDRDYLIARSYREKVYYDAEGNEAKSSFSYRVDAYRTGAERETLSPAMFLYDESIEGYDRLRVTESVELGCGIVENHFEAPQWPYKQPHRRISGPTQESTLYDAAGFYHLHTFDVAFTLDADGKHTVEWPEFLN